MNLSKITGPIVRTFPKQMRWIGAHKSEILTGVGIVSGVAGTVVACRATLKMADVLDETKTQLDQVKEALDLREQGVIAEGKYTPEDAQRDKVLIYAQAVGKAGRLYGPVVILGAISIGCIIGGHNVLRKENAALAAAFTGVTEAFKRYRERVEKEYGPDKEREIYLGAEKVIVETTDSKGKTKQTTIDVVTAEGVSQYARFFDATNGYFKSNAEANLFFLRQQQNWANEKLHADGFLFLNDVYEMLGLPKSQAGCIVGWVEGYGDDYVDFGIYNGVCQNANDFVNGYKETVLLDFNVYGVIDDIFRQKRFEDRVADPRA